MAQGHPYNDDEGGFKGNLKIAASIFAGALLVRLIFFLFMLNQNGTHGIVDLFPDTSKYIKAADYLFGRSSEGEYELYLVGVGYPFFLGALASIIGKLYWPILLIQILLGSLTCIYSFHLARLLFNNRFIAIMTGLISALSMTSISLANSLLSETLFLFLFVAMLYLYFKGLKRNQWTLFIMAGILGGLAVLVRSVAAFFPPLLIVFALLIPSTWIAAPRRQLLAGSILAALIMTAVPSAWALRNAVKYDVLSISATGMGAARLFLAGKVLYTAQERPQREFRDYRDSLYESTVPDIRAGNFRKLNDDASGFVVSALRKHPGLFLRTYLSTVLDNVTAISSLQYIQLPRFANVFKYWDRRINPGFKSPIVLILTLLGFVILIRKNLRMAVILFLIITYYGMMSGVTFGQGSRVYFPAQAVWPIMAGTALIFFFDVVAWLTRGAFTIVTRKKTHGYTR
jgi:4-amino-4-deoxy-L-arabinose transferase-like glycosyltransferase